MDQVPWIAVPFDYRESTMVEEFIPEVGFPTPGIINGRTAEIIERNANGKVDHRHYEMWMRKAMESADKQIESAG